MKVGKPGYKKEKSVEEKGRNLESRIESSKIFRAKNREKENKSYFQRKEKEKGKTESRVRAEEEKEGSKAVEGRTERRTSRVKEEGAKKHSSSSSRRKTGKNSFRIFLHSRSNFVCSSLDLGLS